MSKLDQMLQHDLSGVAYTLTDSATKGRRRSNSGSGVSLLSSDSKTKSKRIDDDLFATVTENLKLSPMPQLRITSPQGVSLTKSRSLPMDKIFESDLYQNQELNKPTHDNGSSVHLAEYNGLAFLGEHISVFEHPTHKQEQNFMHKHHTDHFKRGHQMEMGLARAMSLEGLSTPDSSSASATSSISINPAMIRIPPVTSHLELGDFENIPVFAWFMPYIVSSVPPQFMAILADLPSLLDSGNKMTSAGSAKNSAENLLFGCDLVASEVKVVSPGRHRRHHTATTFAEMSKAGLAFPSDMNYEQFAVLDSPIPLSVLEKHKSFSTFSGLNSSRQSVINSTNNNPTAPVSTQRAVASFPASWKSLGLLWMSKDPTWRPWEVKLVYLLDNYLYEVTADGKVIIGFSPLCGATITRQSYRTSKRDKHLQRHKANISAPQTSPVMTNNSHKKHALELEVPSISTVLMITCYTTTQVDVCPTATFYLTSQVKDSSESSEYDLTRIEAALLQASALTVHDIYDFDVKEKIIGEAVEGNSLNDLRSPSSVGQDGEQEKNEEEEARVLGRGRFTEVRLARRKPGCEVDQDFLNRAATPLSARRPVPVIGSTPSRTPPLHGGFKTDTVSQSDTKNKKLLRTRSGSNGSLSSIPERRRSSLASSHSSGSLLNLLSDSHSHTLHEQDGDDNSADSSACGSDNESNYGEHNFEDVDSEDEREGGEVEESTMDDSSGGATKHSVERSKTPPPPLSDINSLKIDTPKVGKVVTPVVLPKAPPTCAVKLISKELFWTRVNTQQERTDALVREVLAQALLSRFYNIMNQSHHITTQPLPNIIKPVIKTGNVLGSATVGKKSTKEELINKYHAAMSVMTASAYNLHSLKENFNNLSNISQDDSSLDVSRGKQGSNSKQRLMPLSSQNSFHFPASSSSAGAGGANNTNASNNPLPIVEIYHIFETIEGFAIELELMNSLDLFDKLSVEGPMTELQVSYIAAQLVDAVAMCNRMGLAHRDVKLSNVTFPRYDAEFTVHTKTGHGDHTPYNNYISNTPHNKSQQDDDTYRLTQTTRTPQTVHKYRNSSSSSDDDDSSVGEPDDSSGDDSSDEEAVGARSYNDNFSSVSGDNDAPVPYKSPYKPYNFSSDSPVVSTHSNSTHNKNTNPTRSNPRFNLQHSITHSGTTFTQPPTEPTKLLTVKLADFGMAGFLGSDRKIRGRCGTPGYVAPDILCAEKSGAYDINVDMFSIGVAVYTLLVGYEPFYGCDNKELMEANKSVSYAFHSPDWDAVQPDTKDFITQCLQPTAETRLTPENAKKHPFVRRSREAVEQHEREKKRSEGVFQGGDEGEEQSTEKATHASAESCVIS